MTIIRHFSPSSFSFQIIVIAIVACLSTCMPRPHVKNDTGNPIGMLKSGSNSSLNGTRAFGKPTPPSSSSSPPGPAILVTRRSRSSRTKRCSSNHDPCRPLKVVVNNNKIEVTCPVKPDQTCLGCGLKNYCRPLVRTGNNTVSHARCVCSDV